jgi:hypothetical protein
LAQAWRQRYAIISAELRATSKTVTGSNHALMPEKIDIGEILNEIKVLAGKLPDSPSEYSELSSSKRRKLRLDLETALMKLELVQRNLDPITLPEFVFDPTAPRVVGRLVADTLLLQPRRLLSAMVDARFYGAGVYAIYYRGDFDAYQPLSGKDHPLYVGKADPAELHALVPR